MFRVEDVVASSNSWNNTGKFKLRGPYCCSIDNRSRFFPSHVVGGMHIDVKSLCRGNGHLMENGVRVSQID